MKNAAFEFGSISGESQILAGVHDPATLLHKSGQFRMPNILIQYLNTTTEESFNKKDLIHKKAISLIIVVPFLCCRATGSERRNRRVGEERDTSASSGDSSAPCGGSSELSFPSRSRSRCKECNCACFSRCTISNRTLLSGQTPVL